jgi:DNA-binding transcriptional MerR regulator
VTGRISDVTYVRFGGAGRGRIGNVYRPLETRKPIVGVDAVREIRRTVYAGGNPGIPIRRMSATFTRKEVSRLFSLTESRLRYWDRSGFLSPSGFLGQRRCYTFQDLISIRSALELLSSGVSLQRTRAMLRQLFALLPQMASPLWRLRICGDSRQVMVIDEGRRFEADTGQLIFDFTVEKLEEEVIAGLPEYAQKVNRRSAYEWYLEACRLDESPEMLDAAEQAYHQAIFMDPELVNAYTNLGNLRFRRGFPEDARALYLKALELDDRHPEARYNLGVLDFECGDIEKARSHFQRVVCLDPTFADAFFQPRVDAASAEEYEAAQRYWQEYLLENLPALGGCGPPISLCRIAGRELR